MNAHKTLNLFALSLIWLSTIAVRAEEKPNQLLTALDSTTISGYVDTSAHFRCIPEVARRSLAPGLYAAHFKQPKTLTDLKLALVLFPDGRGFCELGEYDSTTHSLTNYCSGNFTNRSNGIISGKFGGFRTRFIGRVIKSENAANLRITIRRGGREHVRTVRLERVGDVVSNSANGWSQTDPVSAANWVAQFPGVERTNLPSVLVFPVVWDTNVIISAGLSGSATLVGGNWNNL